MFVTTESMALKPRQAIKGEELALEGGSGNKIDMLSNKMAPHNRPPAPKFDVTKAGLAHRAQLGVERLENAVSAIVDSLATCSPEDATFENVIRPIAHAENEINFDVQFMSLLQSVAPSSEVRIAASAAGQALDKAYSVAAFLQHEELWLLVDAVYKNAKRETLDAESKLFLDKIHRMFVGKGMQLKGDARERFTKISDRLSELRVHFMDNISADPGCVWVSEQDLDGLSRGQLESLARGPDGKRRITLNKPDVNAVLRQCNVAETRKEVFIRSQSTHADNVPIFREAVLLRDEAARLLGYSSFAAQRLKGQMAKTPETVDKFLVETKERLLPLLRNEMQVLKKLRAEDSPFHFWDFEYYHQKMLKERSVDHELVSEYFPSDNTIRQMMKVFQQLFGLSIEELSDRADDEVWHPDVKVFAVSDIQDGTFIGYLYTDIYPRPGKYNHAANFNIRPVSGHLPCMISQACSLSNVDTQSYIDREGNRVPVATSLICNVSPPSADRPGLLLHSEVVTIFHELGHGQFSLTAGSVFESNTNAQECTTSLARLSTPCFMDIEQSATSPKHRASF